MAYYLVRLIFTFIICVTAFMILRKIMKQPFNRVLRKAVVLFIILYCMIILIPFESVICSFDTIESAFKYTHYKEQILKIVETEHLAFVISIDNDHSLGFNYFGRDNSKWKTQSRFTKPTKSLQMIETSGTMGAIYLRQIVHEKYKTQLIVITQEGITDPNVKVDISDSLNSTYESESFKYLNFKGSDYYKKIYYTVLKQGIEGYLIVINGKTITLQ